jgi:hypothetical protein
MSTEIPTAVVLGRERNALGDLCISLIESIRDDYFPGAPLRETIELMLVMKKIFDMHAVGRATSASALARSTGLARSTVQRRLGYLIKLRAVEKRGTQFVTCVPYVNRSSAVEGFKRRVDIVEGFNVAASAGKIERKRGLKMD